VAEEAASMPGTRMVWDVVEQWLKSQGRVSSRKLNTPRLLGVQGNRGLAA